MAFAEGSRDAIALARSGGRWQANGIEVVLEPRKGGTQAAILVTAPRSKLTGLRFRWHGAFPRDCRFLGDHWERSYGDLEWRGLAGERLMPWYVLASAGPLTHAYGVKTGASAICHWQSDAGGITLWLDVSNGGSGVELGGRRLEAATVVFRRGRAGETPLDAARAFCMLMCDQPRTAPGPIYGGNNWYYAYGQNTSAAASLRDAELLAELSPTGGNRPFSVIDMGWSAGADGAGPAAETTKAYPDMAALAVRMKASGVRPGIWMRPLLTTERRAEGWRIASPGGRAEAKSIVMDPSIPEVLAYVREEVARLRDWGYELIKHDYSTFDITGRWGFQMGPLLTASGWHFADRSRTTAEIVMELYRTIRRAAGDRAVLGCNTIGHLAAGLVEAQRIGDDTSGREWNRTLKMGVNTLAFRMPQHNTFFAADADCVAVTPDVPWNLTRQWLDLVARSGTPLFVSVDPASLKPDQKPAIRAALAEASGKQPAGIPVNWLETTTPELWRLDGQEVRYRWYEED